MPESRLERLLKTFENIDENQKELISNLVHEIVFLETRMNELKKLPFIRVNPLNPELQKPTEAARQYKILSQSYMNGIRILLNVLKTNEQTETNELLNALKDFI